MCARARLTSNKTLEGELPDQEFSRLLVLSNLSEGDSSGPVPVRLLDTSSGGGSLLGGLGGELLSGSLSSGRLSGSLLGSGHCVSVGIRCEKPGLITCEKKKRKRVEERLTGVSLVEAIYFWHGSCIASGYLVRVMSRVYFVENAADTLCSAISLVKSRFPRRKRLKRIPVI